MNDPKSPVRTHRVQAGRLAMASALTLALATLLLLTAPQAAAQTAPGGTAPNGAEGETVLLNPFQVSAQNDLGYSSNQTAIGYQANSILDIAGDITVANHQFLTDIDATTEFEFLHFGTAAASSTSSVTNDDSNWRGFRALYQLRDGIIFTTNRRDPMYDVDRVEFVKGPTGMLLGDTTYLGGVSNYVTKQPTTTMQGDASVAFESPKQAVRTTVDQSGPIVQTSDFSALYRVTLGSENGNQLKPDDTIDQLFIGGGLQFNFFHRRLQVDTEFFYYRDDGYSYYNDFLDLNRSGAGAVGGPNLAKAYLNPLSTDSFAFADNQGQYMHALQEYVRVLLTAHLTENGFLRLDFTGTDDSEIWRIIRGINLLPDNQTLQMQDLLLPFKYPSETVQGTYLYLTNVGFLKNQLLVGFEGDWMVSQSGTIVNPNVPNMNAADPQVFFTNYKAVPLYPSPALFNALGATDKRNITDGGSYWFNDNLLLFNGKIILVGGLRWLQHDTTTETVMGPGTGTFTGVDNPLIKTHRYGAVVRPIESVSLYYVDMDNETPNPGTDEYNNPLLPSFGKDSEYGAKVDFDLGAWHIYGSGAHFLMGLTNVKVGIADPNVPGGIAITQSAEQTSAGYETEWGARYNSSLGHLDFVGNLSHIRTLDQTDGGWVEDAASHVASLWVTYSFTSGPVTGLTFGGGVYDEGKRREANWYVDTPTTYDIMARYAFARHWSVQFNGLNITNRYWIENIAGPGLAVASDPAQYRVGLKYTW